MQVQAIVNNVSPRTVGQGNTIYDIDLGGQVYSTFKPELMRQASEHVGQVITAEVRIEQNGNFTNYTFDGIPGAAPAGPPALGPVAAPPAGQMAPPAQAPMQQLVGPPAPTQAEKDARISFLSVLQSSSRLVGQVYEGAGPEMLIEAEEQATTLAKMWFKLALQAPSVALRPAPLQAVPEPQAQPEQVPVQSEIPDW